MSDDRNTEVALGVAGSIAAYKAVQLTSALVKRGVTVTVVMTRNATRFVGPLSFETVSRNPVITDLQCDPAKRTADHVALSDRCRCLVIAPATANILGKIAAGIADDALSTLVLSFSGPIIIAPAMNTRMWNNAIVQDNVEKLRNSGHVIVGPGEGTLADGKSGPGRLADLDKIVDAVEEVL